MIFSVISTGCLGIPPMRAEVGLGGRASGGVGLAGRAAAGAHLASAWAEAPVDIGAGVTIDRVTGPQQGGSGYYLEAAARLRREPQRRLWLGVRAEHNKSASSERLAMRLDWEVFGSVRQGSVSRSGSSVVGAGMVGATGAGYFAEVGQSLDGGIGHEVFVLAGMSIRLPMTFIGGLFR